MNLLLALKQYPSCQSCSNEQYDSHADYNNQLDIELISRLNILILIGLQCFLGYCKTAIRQLIKILQVLELKISTFLYCIEYLSRILQNLIHMRNEALVNFLGAVHLELQL